MDFFKLVSCYKFTIFFSFQFLFIFGQSVLNNRLDQLSHSRHLQYESINCFHIIIFFWLIGSFHFEDTFYVKMKIITCMVRVLTNRWQFLFRRATNGDGHITIQLRPTYCKISPTLYVFSCCINTWYKVHIFKFVILPLVCNYLWFYPLVWL